MIYQLQTAESALHPKLNLLLLVLFFAAMATIAISNFYMFFERRYALKYKKPFYLNFSLISNNISKTQLRILEQSFDFYNGLSQKNQVIFQNRLLTFINNKKFVSREDFEITEEMRVLISATAVMLTFGFRNYKLELFETIIIYPKAYYSKINKVQHKGETNPQLKTIVFSWEDFKHGFKIGDDNLNLGIHEFGHAIHLNAMRKKDISSVIFRQGFNELTHYLSNNENVRKELLATKYFRAYAYTNQYEFFAVLLENFIETPEEFRSNFPELYNHMKDMLNFNFAGY